MEHIDAEKINAFVREIEDARGFVRDHRLVFAHLVEEVGELSRAIWQWEKSARGAEASDPSAIVDELIDIVFLACWLADIYGADLDRRIPARIAAIRKQYKVPERRAP